MSRNLLSSLRDFGINAGNVSGDCRHRHRAIVPAGTELKLPNHCQYVMKLLAKILHGVAPTGAGLQHRLCQKLTSATCLAPRKFPRQCVPGLELWNESFAAPLASAANVRFKELFDWHFRSQNHAFFWCPKLMLNRLWYAVERTVDFFRIRFNKVQTFCFDLFDQF